MADAPPGARSLSSRERAARYWTDPVAAARKGRPFVARGTVAEIDADLAVLRAVAGVQRRRRTWCAVAALLLLAAGPAIAFQGKDTHPEFLVIGVVAALATMIGRAFVKRWEPRRIDFASGVLRRLTLDGKTPITLTLELRTTQRQPFATDDPGPFQRGGQYYRNPWFRLEAQLPDGDRLTLVRTEHLGMQSTSIDPRTVRTVWTYHFEDTVEIGFARPHAAFDPARAPSLAMGEALRVTRLDGDSAKWTLSVRGDRLWTASTEGGIDERTVDGVALTLKWVTALAELAGLPSSVAGSSVPAISARLWTWGSRAASAALFFLVAVPAGFWTVLRAQDYGDRNHPEYLTSAAILGDMDPLGSLRREVLTSGAIAATALTTSILLWFLPARRARRRRTA
jgi:hypothetical protein